MNGRAKKGFGVKLGWCPTEEEKVRSNCVEVMKISPSLGRSEREFLNPGH